MSDTIKEIETGEIGQILTSNNDGTYTWQYPTTHEHGEPIFVED